MPSAGEDMKQQELTYSANRNINWNDIFGEQCWQNRVEDVQILQFIPFYMSNSFFLSY